MLEHKKINVIRGLGILPRILHLNSAAIWDMLGRFGFLFLICEKIKQFVSLHAIMFQLKMEQMSETVSLIYYKVIPVLIYSFYKPFGLVFTSHDIRCVFSSSFSSITRPTPVAFRF